MNIIQVKNIIKEYQDNIAVDGIDLTVKQGQIYG